MNEKWTEGDWYPAKNLKHIATKVGNAEFLAFPRNQYN